MISKSCKKVVKKLSISCQSVVAPGKKTKILKRVGEGEEGGGEEGYL
jgi:hypothetical protein